MRNKTWKVLSWRKSENDPVTGIYPVTCECGVEAMLPVSGVGVIVEAVIGMNLITDPKTPPPSGFQPDKIKCRKCLREYQSH